MNATELAELMFAFDPKTDLVLFYGANMGWCVTAFYNFGLIACRVLNRFIPKHEIKDDPIAKLTNVIVEQRKGVKEVKQVKQVKELKGPKEPKEPKEPKKVKGHEITME